jgi:hypothetical protein
LYIRSLIYSDLKKEAEELNTTVSDYIGDLYTHYENEQSSRDFASLTHFVADHIQRDLPDNIKNHPRIDYHIKTVMGLLMNDHDPVA